MNHSKLRSNATLPTVLRFLAVGGSGTLLSYSIYIVLSFYIDAWLAFSLAYIVGLFFNVLLGSRWVFQAGVNRIKLIKFAVLHLFLYLIGRLIIFALDPLQFSDIILSAVLIAGLTTPISFLVGRRIFTMAPEPGNDVAQKEEGV
jgi:putative flippase GtrA